MFIASYRDIDLSTELIEELIGIQSYAVFLCRIIVSKFFRLCFVMVSVLSSWISQTVFLIHPSILLDKAVRYNLQFSTLPYLRKEKRVNSGKIREQEDRREKKSSPLNRIFK